MIVSFPLEPPPPPRQMDPPPLCCICTARLPRHGTLLCLRLHFPPSPLSLSTVASWDPGSRRHSLVSLFKSRCITAQTFVISNHHFRFTQRVGLPPTPRHKVASHLTVSDPHAQRLRQPTLCDQPIERQKVRPLHIFRVSLCLYASDHRLLASIRRHLAVYTTPCCRSRDHRLFNAHIVSAWSQTLDPRRRCYPHSGIELRPLVRKQ